MNIGFVYVPLVPIFGVMFPPMAFGVGLIFIVRDYAQRDHGHRVLVAMLAALVISYYMASPIVAIASACAFAVSESIDWLIYTVLKKPFAMRVFASSLISTPIDSAVFLYMIGHFSIVGVVLMTFAKMLPAIVVGVRIVERAERKEAA